MSHRRCLTSTSFRFLLVSLGVAVHSPTGAIYSATLRGFTSFYAVVSVLHMHYAAFSCVLFQREQHCSLVLGFLGNAGFQKALKLEILYGIPYMKLSLAFN